MMNVMRWLVLGGLLAVAGEGAEAAAGWSCDESSARASVVSDEYGKSSSERARLAYPRVERERKYRSTSPVYHSPRRPTGDSPTAQAEASEKATAMRDRTGAVTSAEGLDALAAAVEGLDLDGVDVSAVHGGAGAEVVARDVRPAATFDDLPFEHIRSFLSSNDQTKLASARKAARGKGLRDWRFKRNFYRLNAGFGSSCGLVADMLVNLEDKFGDLAIPEIDEDGHFLINTHNMCMLNLVEGEWWRLFKVLPASGIERSEIDMQYVTFSAYRDQCMALYWDWVQSSRAKDGYVVPEVAPGIDFSSLQRGQHAVFNLTWRFGGAPSGSLIENVVVLKNFHPQRLYWIDHEIQALCIEDCSIKSIAGLVMPNLKKLVLKNCTNLRVLGGYLPALQEVELYNTPAEQMQPLVAPSICWQLVRRQTSVLKRMVVWKPSAKH